MINCTKVSFANKTAPQSAANEKRFVFSCDVLYLVDCSTDVEKQNGWHTPEVWSIRLVPTASSLGIPLRVNYLGLSLDFPLTGCGTSPCDGRKKKKLRILPLDFCIPHCYYLAKQRFLSSLCLSFFVSSLSEQEEKRISVLQGTEL